MLTLYSWNVNGIRAAKSKGFLDWLHVTQPEILCLQEIKAQPHQLDEEIHSPAGYNAHWFPAQRPGYSGVALFTRRAPSHIQLGLGIDKFDREGRTIVADLHDFVLINTYVPHGTREHRRVPFKMEYKKALLAICDSLRNRGRPVVLAGDVNTAHREIDLARPRENINSSGFLPLERAWIDRVVAAGYLDTFRTLHPDEAGAYTWWAHGWNLRQRNVGWRLDYFFVSPDLRPRVLAAGIHPEVVGSDHCPISLTLDI